jgi:hypothetical protein
MTNTTMALNRADRGGGLDAGMYSLLTHVTVVSNTANPSGGGLSNLGFPSAFFLVNSLVAYNGASNCIGNISAGGASMQYPGSSCGGAATSDPLLRPVADNGGLTLTAALSRGSPAVDAAAPAYCPPTDQRGRPRPAGAGCDIGAFELWFDLRLPLVRR